MVGMLLTSYTHVIDRPSVFISSLILQNRALDNIAIYEEF